MTTNLNPKAKIEQIVGDNWRPGMPKEGWLVRYNLCDFGWKCQKCFSDYLEAEAFFKEKYKE